MKAIYKYPLLGSGMFSTIYPIYENAVPLHVGVARDQICIWFQVDTDNELEERKIHIRGTGQPFTGEEGIYIGTIITPSNTAWHYFDDAPVWKDPSRMASVAEAWEKEILEESKSMFPQTTELAPSKN